MFTCPMTTESSLYAQTLFAWIEQKMRVTLAVETAAMRQFRTLANGSFLKTHCYPTGGAILGGKIVLSAIIGTTLMLFLGF
jgi:hypothetical protein